MNYKLLLNPLALGRGVKRRVARYLKLNKVIKYGRQRLQKYPAYRTDLVPAGFAPRKRDGDDKELLERICTAYIKAKEDQAVVSDTFKVSNEWLPIYERQLGPVMQALMNRDITTLRGIYRNFNRDPCSTGLNGLPVDMEKCYFGSQIKEKYRHLFLCDVVHRHELWKQETRNKYSITDLVSPDIGNPYGFFLDGVFLKGGSDYQHYYATKIKSLLPPSDPHVVAELGGGFGGMAYYLIRDNPQGTYINLDLPETLALATYYLLTAFPTIPALLYGERELSSEAMKKYPIVLMPSFEIKKIKSKSISVSFNSYSLAEMSPSAIAEYISNITRITKSYFMHINHTRNAVVTADNFGVERHGFKLRERRVAGWTLGLNPDADEFEFLYQAES